MAASSGRALARGLALGAASVVGVSLVGALFLVVLAAKERDNRFCVSCHLHDEKFGRLIAAASMDLAGRHYQKKAEVGCIACHGGADPVMRVKVWTVAGLDTVKFLAGIYREPTHMRLALRDAECRQCHTPILPVPRLGASGSGGHGDATDESTFAGEAETEGRGGTSYHAIREHDTVHVRCVSCHTAHTTDSDAASRFISRARVVPVCRECHKEMELR
jgi:predicted CXXCH cytochrome family protein